MAWGCVVFCNKSLIKPNWTWLFHCLKYHSDLLVQQACCSKRSKLAWHVFPFPVCVIYKCIHVLNYVYCINIVKLTFFLSPSIIEFWHLSFLVKSHRVGRWCCTILWNSHSTPGSNFHTHWKYESIIILFTFYFSLFFSWTISSRLKRFTHFIGKFASLK